MRIFNYILAVFLFQFWACGQSQSVNSSKTEQDSTNVNPDLQSEIIVADTTIYPGAHQTNSYLDQLKNQRIGLVVNQSSLINNTHLIDTLLSHDINVVKIFAPEHGFRGTADAGEHIDNAVDEKTGLPVISLYGNNKKPKAEQFKDLDLVIFDIQDVGVRFYTYISTMHYVMEACAENNVKLIVFDRPNPNGDYVAGPVLDINFQSFVGMHPIPIVHGLTVGELAKMINGEKWLNDSLVCDLEVVPCKNYTHQSKYELPVKPSPNLPNYLSIRLYPTLCVLEPSQISVGRGTTHPFQVLGSPHIDTGFCFTPVSIEGMSKYPKHQDKKCCGQDFRDMKEAPKFTLRYLYDYYHSYPDKNNFYTSRNFFNKILGTDKVANLLESGASYQEFEDWYQSDLDQYKEKRKQYLIYPE